MDGKQNKSIKDKNTNSKDIQTDAYIDPDDNDVPSSPMSPVSVLSVNASCIQTSDASSDLQSTSSEKSFTSLTPPSLQLVQTARPVTSADEDEYKEHIELMPDKLREENIDILIVNAESDRKAAKYFQDHLAKDILFYAYGWPRYPRVKLLDEIRHGSMDNLDFAFFKSLYVFLFVTKDFCQEPWTLLQGQACLTEAIYDSQKKWCVVPIHTTSKKNRHYKLPMMLNALKAINYWSGDEDQFYVEGVRMLLESKISLILERERDLDKARQKYFNENRTEILEKAKYKDKGLPECTNNLSCQASSSDYKSQTFHANSVKASSITSPVQTGSSDYVYRTQVYRYSSFSNTLDDKAVPDVSQAGVEEGMQEMTVAASEPVDQNNELHVNIRCSPTDRSDQRPNQEAAACQLSDRDSEISQTRLQFQQGSGRNPEQLSQGTPQQARQGQGIPEQATGRNPGHHHQGTSQQATGRNPEQLSQGTSQQATGRNPEQLSQGKPQQARQGQGKPQQATGRNPEHHHQGTSQEARDRNPIQFSQGTPQQATGNNHEHHRQGTSQHTLDRSRERQDQGISQQASGRRHEQQSQVTHQHVSDRRHERQNQGIPQRSQILTLNAVHSGNEQGSGREKFTTDTLNSVDVDGPDNQVPHVHQNRSLPTTTALSFQSSTPPFSAPQNMQSGIATTDHPTSSPVLGYVNNPNTNLVNAGSSPPYLQYFHHGPPSAFYPLHNPPLYPHMHPSFSPLHYPVRANNMEDLYDLVKPIIQTGNFYQYVMRSHSQTSLVAPSDGSTQTSMEANSPDSVRSDLSHSSSTGTLSTIGSLSGLNHYCPPSENLAGTSVAFNPQPVSNRYCAPSDPTINQPAEGASASTARQSQSRTSSAARQGSFEGNYFRTGQTVAAADTHSSAKSDRTPSAGPSSAATSVIQHVHHHHHKKIINVTNATNLLIGDKSQILNKNSVDVISDDESGGDDEDDAGTPASQSGTSNSSRFKKNSSDSREDNRAANSHVHSEKEGSINVSMGFQEFMSSPSSRQPIEMSETEHSENDDAESQTSPKKLD